ncbi:Protein of unknown function (DUF3887) [Aquimarina sp. MAR_2010_214]|uniref:hypothetical protein n=1 Tax=Aquimarina sp. MAR_2010_214 TaxID=1250026 RepID=UPI000C712E5D|nr:hypothetical protein [Aquimarina sp. MAR_2010_214]PKV51517.1 Protein of unknown function (DUF3887) [Aquimarina sp. MAR_2010_214]
MKKILSIILFLFLQISFSQTQEDYQEVISEITNAYNTKDADKVFNAFSVELQSTFTLEKVKQFVSENQTKKGPMGASAFLLDEEKAKRYLTEFENTSMILILGISPDKKITKLTLEEY